MEFELILKTDNANSLADIDSYLYKMTNESKKRPFELYTGYKSGTGKDAIFVPPHRDKNVIAITLEKKYLYSDKEHRYALIKIFDYAASDTIRSLNVEIFTAKGRGTITEGDDVLLKTNLTSPEAMNKTLFSKLWTHDPITLMLCVQKVEQEVAKYFRGKKTEYKPFLKEANRKKLLLESFDEEAQHLIRQTNNGLRF